MKNILKWILDWPEISKFKLLLLLIYIAHIVDIEYI